MPASPVHLRLLLLCLLVCSTPAKGDGGIVRVSENAGPWRITLFSSPTPLRAGPIDLSILVQEPHTDDSVLAATVNLMLQPLDGQADSILVEATRADATNKLLYAALLDLPAPGRWQVDVAVQLGDDGGRITTTLVASDAIPPLLSLWTWLVIPVIAIALFLCNQWLVRSRRRTTSSPTENMA
ncbi:MAG: hypothetical protein P8K80_08790 [Phycisphaerales bacterium]|nr:hypothetical protein [Phycisphaerales bacterium]